MKRLLIIGAGGHGKVIREIAESIGIYHTICYIDDHCQCAIGRISDLPKFRSEYDSAIVSIGDNQLREKIYRTLKELQYEIPILIHTTAYLSKSCQIGAGTVIEPKAVVNSNVVIGEGCIISPGAIIDHDVTIGRYVHVNSGSVIMAGSNVRDFLKIEAGSVFNRK